MDFEAFPKIPRYNRGLLITEKIDGTNAQVAITEDGRVLAGSRTRWVTPEQDNFGFAGWVAAHEEELRQLGPGRHYGEWWGLGIQRGYGLYERRFSLFNALRWTAQPPPPCCSVVPVLYRGVMTADAVGEALRELRQGSRAAPGFMRPEGIVVYHMAGRTSFKVTLEGDEEPKAVREEMRAALADRASFNVSASEEARAALSLHARRLL